MTCHCTITSNITTPVSVETWLDHPEIVEARLEHPVDVSYSICLPGGIGLPPVAVDCGIIDHIGRQWVDHTGTPIVANCPSVGVGIFTEQFTDVFV